MSPKWDELRQISKKPLLLSIEYSDNGSDMHLEKTQVGESKSRYLEEKYRETHAEETSDDEQKVSETVESGKERTIPRKTGEDSLQRGEAELHCRVSRWSGVHLVGIRPREPRGPEPVGL